MATTIKHSERALAPAESFVPRHIGPTEADISAMLETLGFASLDDLMDATIPEKIRYRRGLKFPTGKSEADVLTEFRAIAANSSGGRRITPS